MKQTLDKIDPGKEVTVKDLTSEDTNLFRRLLTLGFTEGSRVRVLRRAPFGDPITVSALGYTLALRLSEAQSIIVS